MRVIGIDPGTTESGLAVLNGGHIESGDIVPNEALLDRLVLEAPDHAHLGIEMIASYGMPVGREVFETVVWIGRFVERWETMRRAASPPAHLVYRREVKLHLCDSPRAKDPNVRQALLDRWGPPGKKAAPGPTYGFKSHMWAALGVATTLQDRLLREAGSTMRTAAVG